MTCETQDCDHVHCPECRLGVKNRDLDCLAELPYLEPWGSELHIPGIPQAPSTKSPHLLSPLPSLLSRPELREKQTRRKESTEDKTLYNPSNDHSARERNMLISIRSGQETRLSGAWMGYTEECRE
jgi:hypothetical protein